MAIIREHFATKGLGLHNDLQNEHSIVGNNVGLMLMIRYGTEQQKAEWIDDLAEGRRGFAFGITSRTTGRTRRTWRRPPSVTATSGSSTARRRGTRASTRRSTT
jgi:alkylation response protein AidB-like acyl-CoA dehydrogenase